MTVVTSLRRQQRHVLDYLSEACRTERLGLPPPSLLPISLPANSLLFPNPLYGYTFYQLDENLHRHVRTTNHLERLFREFRTKSDEIGAFPHETSCLTVFFSLLSAIMPNMTVNLWRKIRDTNQNSSEKHFEE
jgi:Transposase, Mutator family